MNRDDGNTGSPVRSRLYLVSRHAGEKQALTGNELPEMERGCILLVDDENVILEVIREILKKLGYRVLTAGSGPEAIETYKLGRTEIDLILMGMIMPYSCGDRVLRELRSINPEVKVILSSGYSEQFFSVGGLLQECQGFIQKPFGVKDLKEKIEAALG
ncbi:MAG: response regulator [Syntrophales bacterium]|nr:response regulator [Syntrophales bacterium]MDD5232681.1 response regulator [Syntrophales bacterium]MDD5533193.1 response regulator [Syntrophales bacterium]